MQLDTSTETDKTRNIDELGHWDVEALIQRATLAFYRRCKQLGINFNQPCKVASDVEGKEVVLRSTKGELARYRITRAGNLRFVEVAE